MKVQVRPLFWAAVVLSALCLGAPRPTFAAPPFETGVYLYNQAYDTTITSPDGIAGTGNWENYRKWLNAPVLGVEADPGENPGDWYDCCQNVSWNWGWGTMTTRHTASLGDVILCIGQMPYSPSGYDLSWEDQEWQNEAADDSTEMGYFKSYVDSLHSAGFRAHSVIIRMGYEFDGGWNSWGNLNQMSNMPANYIAAWQNIVNAMRAEDATYSTQVLKGFLWNPTDGNVQVNSFSFYPGDAYVDYIGFDEYDYDYAGDYNGYTQPTAAEQASAWTNVELPRINAFANFASASNTSRPGYGGGAVPLIVGEWGTWQSYDPGQPGGGDNPSYIQNMYNWMSANNVAMEVYFEAPSNGISTLSDFMWGAPSPYPQSEAAYLGLFGGGNKPPATPTRVVAHPQDGRVEVTWLPGDGIPLPTFDIYRGTTATNISSAPIASGVTGSSYVDGSATNNTAYYYEVRAVNSSGSSRFSAQAHCMPKPTAIWLAQAQSNWGSVQSAASYEAPFASPQTAGDMNIVVIGYDPTPGVAISSVSDSAGNTYVPVSPPIENGDSATAVYYASNIGGYSGQNLVTVTFTGAMDWPGTEIMEVGGVDALDASAQGDGVGTAATAQLASTAHRYELVVGGYTSDMGSTSAVASGFKTGPGRGSYGSEIGIVDVKGSYSVGATFRNTNNTAGDWSMQAASFYRFVAHSRPLAPAGPLATACDGSVSLSWQASLGTSDYLVFRGPASGEETRLIGTVADTRFIDKNVANGRTYYYEVKAANDYGKSAPSNEVSATPEASNLTGSVSAQTSAVALTALGTSDWGHWGYSGLEYDHMSSGDGRIGFTLPDDATQYSQNLFGYSWTNGLPTASASDTATGVYSSQAFTVTAPADTTQRTLDVFVGGYYSAGTLNASLSDGSAPIYTDTESNLSGHYNEDYTLSYRAASAGQILTVTWKMTGGSYNVTLQSAALH